MNFQQYIKPELLILIPVLYIVGVGIKKSNVADKFIPLILGIIGVLLAGLYVFATSPITGTQAVFTALFTALTQGILCAGASVYTNQVIKQFTNNDKNKE